MGYREGRVYKSGSYFNFVSENCVRLCKYLCPNAKHNIEPEAGRGGGPPASANVLFVRRYCIRSKAKLYAKTPTFAVIASVKGCEYGNSRHRIISGVLVKIEKQCDMLRHGDMVIRFSSP
eukprot:scaffold4918_cov46-Cyclotella_meneghiniana.AAC.8